jgi:hypothetical protein
MNPAATNTQIYRTPEVIEHLAFQTRPDAERHQTSNQKPGYQPKHYAPAHHATELIPRVPGEETVRVDIGRMSVPVPQPERLVPPPAVSAAAPKVGLLERVLRKIRDLL